MGLEEELQKIADSGGDPWASMSMGGGRKKDGPSWKECPKSPDGIHHYTCTECVQSVEKFVCDHCGDWHID